MFAVNSDNNNVIGMAYIYIKNNDFLKLFERANKEKRRLSDILSEQLNQTNIIEKKYYFEKLTGESKKRWHEYITNPNGELVLKD